MGRTRLEAFSDGVLAIIITIMVLELKVPHDTSIEALRALLPVFLSYVMSFVYVGIYWNNHHHMLHTCTRVTGAVLWANLHLLFWLSLLPFASGWMGENGFASTPSLLYGVVLLGSALAYTLLQNAIIRAQGPESLLKRAVQGDVKGLISLAGYVTAIALSFRWPLVSQACYTVVALTWLVPDRRIERAMAASEHAASTVAR